MPKTTKKNAAKLAAARLSLLASDDPPREFRIFKKGMNKTTKGDFLFDDEAAKLVMAEYRKHGVDVMIDLEHLSLDSEGNNYDPSAYGWCKLELRGGELWAVNVAWTKAGAARLKNKESRYISPAFHFLTESGRVTELYNIAICAVPATYETPALVAASARTGKKIGTLTVEVDNMDKIALLLGLKEDATMEEILAAIKALQSDEDGGGGDEDTADDTDTDGDDEDTADDEDTSGDGDDASATSLAAVAASIKSLPKKMQATILASMASGPELVKRLAKLEKTSKRDAIEALIAANADKLPKSLESWARDQSVESLRVYFKNAQPVKKETKQQPQREDTTGEVTLTAEDRKVIKLTNGDPVKFLEQKKKMAQERKDRELAAAAD